MYKPGFYSIDRIIEISDKLESTRTGHNGFNMNDLAEWLQYEAPKLKALAEETRNYLTEILNPDYPDNMLILHEEHDQTIKEVVGL